MRIAVTGGSGLLGRAVTDLAVRTGHEVVSVDRAAPHEHRDGVTYCNADTTQFDDFVRAVDGTDALVHLAAYIRPGTVPDNVVHNTNVTSSYNALSIAVELGMSRVCLASSVNAIGGFYSRNPRYDYFPVDEAHPTYAEDPYSLSKWVAEQQADSFARRHEHMSIASLRLHALRDRPQPDRARPERGRKHLWGYTPLPDAAHACLAALLADFRGSEAFFVVADDTASDVASLELRDRFYPDVPVVGDLRGHRSFFDSRKARILLGLPAGAREPAPDGI
jgi:nucleoside-diphosphate-sugar epimerase